MMTVANGQSLDLEVYPFSVVAWTNCTNCKLCPHTRFRRNRTSNAEQKREKELDISVLSQTAHNMSE